MSIQEASRWAGLHVNKEVTPANISYLIQYGRIKKHINKGITSVSKQDLINYYQSYSGQRQANWREQLGDDLNWSLSFDRLKEKETTKHVHRLHPYKGKFIPQLVEYFLDNHIDDYKQRVFFKKGDIILDPFSGSGTTMIQAHELGMHALGIDISAFNALMANVKVSQVDFTGLNRAVERITKALSSFIAASNHTAFEQVLKDALGDFNRAYFPSPEFKIKLRQGEIIEKDYAPAKEREFSRIFDQLQKQYELKIAQDNPSTFMSKWYLYSVRQEIDFVTEQVKKIADPTIKEIITIILSRTIRTCRATTHADLATLKVPVTSAYYCSKHGKICKPLFSIFSWWKRYCLDTVDRLGEFNKLRTSTFQHCLQGDARDIDIFSALNKINPKFSRRVQQRKIAGIFSSPPYIGLIDYHQQHAYAYDLFGFKRRDELEIGPLFKGQGRAARQSYVEGIAQVLNNAKQYLQADYNVFLVANDKYNLYPTIAKKANMQIVNQYKRPVLNRTEKGRAAYAEIIFHLKEK